MNHSPSHLSEGGEEGGDTVHIFPLTNKGTVSRIFLKIMPWSEIWWLCFSYSHWYPGYKLSFVELLPLQPSFWFNSPHLPLPCVNKYTVYTYTVCKGEGFGVLGLRQIKHLYRSIFFRWRHFALPSLSLIFLRLISMYTITCRQSQLSRFFNYWQRYTIGLP